MQSEPEDKRGPAAIDTGDSEDVGNPWIPTEEQVDWAVLQCEPDAMQALEREGGRDTVEWLKAELLHLRQAGMRSCGPSSPGGLRLSPLDCYRMVFNFGVAIHELRRLRAVILDVSEFMNRMAEYPWFPYRDKLYAKTPVARRVRQRVGFAPPREVTERKRKCWGGAMGAEGDKLAKEAAAERSRLEVLAREGWRCPGKPHKRKPKPV